MPHHRRHITQRGRVTAWAEPWKAWGKAYRCRIHKGKAEPDDHEYATAEVRIVGADHDQLSGYAPVAQGLAVAEVYALVVAEACGLLGKGGSRLRELNSRTQHTELFQ